EVLDALAQEAVLLAQLLAVLAATTLAGLELEPSLALLVAHAHRVQRDAERTEDCNKSDQVHRGYYATASTRRAADRRRRGCDRRTRCRRGTPAASTCARASTAADTPPARACRGDPTRCC